MEEEKEIATIRKLMFSHAYPEMLQRTQVLLAKLASEKQLDQIELKRWLIVIFMAMKKQDYLLVADTLTYEILPLWKRLGG